MVSTMSDGWKFEQVNLLLRGHSSKSSFHVLHPPGFAHIDPKSPIFNIRNGLKKKQTLTANGIFLNVRIHDPSIPSVL